MKRKLAAFWVGVLLLIACGCPAGEEKIRISPMIRYQGNLLFIKNGDGFNYGSVNVTLNGAFKKELRFWIQAGEEEKIDLFDFAKSDGERFDVVKYKPTDIVISCDVVKPVEGKWQSVGRGFYSGRF